jgi:hypothetical protein
VHRQTGEERDSDPGDPQTWRRINLWRGHDYFYDADAVRETSAYPDDNRKARQRMDEERAVTDRIATINPLNPKTYPERNLRNVWTIATAPYPAAHFATFPPELAERCIRAGTSERGCCAACGAPWVRVTEATPEYQAKRAEFAAIIVIAAKDSKEGRLASGAVSRPQVSGPTTFTIGWSPSCQCEAATVPCTVLDPFSGAGTALLVADRLGRDAIGIDLSGDYQTMATNRITNDLPLFTEIEHKSDRARAMQLEMFTL